MNGDLLAAAALATPAALFAAITFTGHARARRADDTLAAALTATTAQGGPDGPGEPETAPAAPEPLAPVLHLPLHPTTANTREENAA